MRKVRKMVVMLLMVFGAVGVSFGDIGYGNIDMLKAEMKKFEAYWMERKPSTLESVKEACEEKIITNSYYFYCEAKVGLLLLEEAKAKNIDYFSYDMAKFIWGDERFERFRNWGYGGKLDIGFSSIKDDFESFWEKRGLRDAKSKAWKGMAEGIE